MGIFKRKPKVQGIPTENPWLDIPHECDMLPANDGKERVCGLCGKRVPEE